MRKNRLLILLFLVALPSLVNAQTRNPLRDSLDVADAALRLNPDSVDLRLKKARWNIELGEWEYAKDEYDLILHYHPENLSALFYRAFVNEKLNRYGFARQDYMAILTAVPNNFEAKLGLALLDDKDNKKTKAMDEINLLVQAFPDSAIAYAARAGMERDRGQYYLAAYDYGEALTRDPQNRDYILGRADVLISLGKKDDARRDLELLVRLGVPKAALAEFFERLK